MKTTFHQYFRQNFGWLDRAVGYAVKREAERLAEEMRKRCPVETGTLRASIRVEPTLNPKIWRVAAGGPTTTKEVRSGSGVAYDYSRGVEFGTVEAPAEPFFFTTYRAQKRTIRQNFESYMRQQFSQRGTTVGAILTGSREV